MGGKGGGGVHIHRNMQTSEAECHTGSCVHPSRGRSDVSSSVQEQARNNTGRDVCSPWTAVSSSSESRFPYHLVKVII